MDDDDIAPLDRYAIHTADFATKILNRTINVHDYIRETVIDEGTPFDLMEQAHRLSAMANACQLAAIVLMARKPAAKRERKVAA